MSRYFVTPLGESFQIHKLSESFEHEASYTVSASTCDCPAGQRPTCRHRTMLAMFVNAEHIADGWMLDYDAARWIAPREPDPPPPAQEPEVVASLPASGSPIRRRRLR